MAGPPPARANPPRRVLHVLAPQRAGGLERAVELLAAGQVARGHRVEAVLLLDPVGDPPPLLAALEAAGVPVTPVRVPARFYWREVRAVGYALQTSRSTILHAHGYRADVLSVRAARDQGAALVSTAHGFTGNDAKNRFYEWLDRRVLRRYDAVLAVSEPLRNLLVHSGVDPARVSVIPNGVAAAAPRSREDACRALGLSPDRRYVGWVGRMTREKGADLLVESLRPLAGQLAEVVVIGDGPERPAVEAAAGAGFRFAGLVPEAATYLSAFDVMVLSSRTEGTPMILLEAVQAGVPVVAFAVGGVPDVLENGAGWLVPPGDETSLRESVAHALQDPEARSTRARAARLRVEERFGLESWLDRVEEIYAEVDRVRR